MLRMFFCCTHVTLRATEVPIWLATGVEVVPEEVDTAVLNRMESLTYDSAEVHPVLKECRTKCTLPPAAWNTARRIRLRSRRGKLTPTEVDFFNSSFDIVYVATDLETAVNVKRWFKGEVLYRYFGQHDNLRNIRDMAARFTAEELRDIVCLPVFSTLNELGIPEFFRRVVTMHGYVRPTDVGATWPGYQENQPAVVVQTAVREGVSQTEDLRQLLHLSENIPLELLGKNAKARVPTDIRERFHVVGPLERKTYFKRFLAGRLLIHPFANRFHNQYTNLEGIVGGMPVLFLVENPLYLEQGAELKSWPPESLGAFQTIEQLCRMVEQVYDQPEQLAELVARQRKLLGPYTWENVLAEARAVLRILRPSARAGKVILAGEQPLALVPCAANLELQAKFFQFAESVPYYTFAKEESWRHLAIGASRLLVLRLSPQDSATSVVLGAENRIPPGTYDLEIKGRKLGGAFFLAAIQLHADRRVVSALRLAPPCSPDGEFKIKAHLETIKPCELSIRTDVQRAGAVELESIALVRRSQAATQMALVSADDVWSRLVSGDWTDVEGLVNIENTAHFEQATNIAEGLNLSTTGEPAKLMLKQGANRLPPDGFALELGVVSKRRGCLRIWMRTWTDNRAIDKTRVNWVLTNGMNIVRLEGKPTPGVDGVTPVLFMQAPPPCDARVVKLRMTAGVRRAAG